MLEEKNQNKVLTSFKFIPGKVEKGYTNRRLYINLSKNKIEEKPIENQVKEIFTGGRGYGLWYLWNAIKPNTKWNDPENEILFGTGPICGLTQYAGTGKLHVVTLSPETGSAMDNNAGGYFAPYLKFSGWDLLEIQGKSKSDVLIFIDGNEGKVVIEEAEGLDIDTYLLIQKLTERFSTDEKDKKNISIVSSGMGAQNSYLGMLNISWYDNKRQKVRIKQAGRGGTGTVFRDKRIVAIVIKYHGVNANSNHSAKPEMIREIGKKYTDEILTLDPLQNNMRETGSVMAFDHMAAHNCLPVHNYKFGSHPDAHKTSKKEVWDKRFTKDQSGDSCWIGCTMRCSHAVDDFELSTGPLKGMKVIVDGPEYETTAGFAGNCGCFDPDFVLEANFYCDHYGLDTIGTSSTISFLMECYENNIINKKITGGLELNFGNSKAVLELIHQIAQNKGFGKIAGLGVRQARKILVEKYNADENFLRDIGMECKGLEISEYYTKESLAQQGGFGLANKGPQHDENWLIFMDQVKNQIPTFEDKSEAIHYFSLFRTWLSLVGVCKLPWNDVEPTDNKKYQGIEAAKVPEHVQNYCGLFEGVTGKYITSEELLLQSQRVHCFQRLFNLRMGFGTRKEDRMPYRALGPVTTEEYNSQAELYDKKLKEINYDIQGKTVEEKMKGLRVHRENQYDKLCSAVYQKRGWDSNGVPTLETVKRLKIDFPDVLELLCK